MVAEVFIFWAKSHVRKLLRRITEETANQQNTADFKSTTLTLTLTLRLRGRKVSTSSNGVWPYIGIFKYYLINITF